MTTDPRKNSKKKRQAARTLVLYKSNAPAAVDKRLRNAIKRMFRDSEPSAAEKAQGMVAKNVCPCGICGAAADRFEHHIQCRDHKEHYADPFIGMFVSHHKELKTA